MADQKTTSLFLPHQGIRYNAGKDRHDLIHPIAQEELAKVFTMGAKKYADRNWEKGMSWTSTIASLKRHLNAFEMGEDRDTESGLLHMSHVAWGAHVLTTYYSIYPEGDDRPHRYLSGKKIGLDIDGVLCDWVGAWCAKFDLSTPSTWHFDYDTGKRFQEMKEKGELDTFYLNLAPKIQASELLFEPHCYVTSRPVDKAITEKWLQMHGFPCRPVYSLALGASKLESVKASGANIFVDDCYDNFVELNKNGVCCYLFDTPQNQSFSVGHKRVKSLKELVK